MITDIYRIRTMNSIYEIEVYDEGRKSRARKAYQRGSDGRVEDAGRAWKNVKAEGTEYLKELAIGPSFDIPGAYVTSMVEDYVHFVPMNEPKRYVKRPMGIAEAMAEVTDHIVRVARGEVR